MIKKIVISYDRLYTDNPLIKISLMHMERLQKIKKNEAVWSICGCTRDKSCTAMRYLLDFAPMGKRVQLSRHKTASNKHRQGTCTPVWIDMSKGNRLKRGKSWSVSWEYRYETRMDTCTIRIQSGTVSSFYTWTEHMLRTYSCCNMCLCQSTN